MQRGQSLALFSAAQLQDNRQWTQITNTQDVPIEHQEALFLL